MADISAYQLRYPGLRISYNPETLLTIDISKENPKSLVMSSTQGHIAIVSDHFSLVPDAYYHADLQKNYLLDLGMSPDTNCKTLPIDLWSAHLIFSLEKIPDNYKIDLVHSIWEPLFLYSWHLFNQTYAPALYVHLTPDFIFIIGGEKGKLHFFNQFKVHTSEDHLFFILRSIADWHKDPHLLDVYLSGHYLDDSPLYDLLDQYIGKLIPAPAYFDQLKGLEGHPEYQFVDLRSFAACV
jgi:hypothetical protein